MRGYEFELNESREKGGNTNTNEVDFNEWLDDPSEGPAAEVVETIDSYRVKEESRDFSYQL